MFVEQFSDLGKKVVFYTIRKEGADFNEVEKFFNKIDAYFNQNPTKVYHKERFNYLLFEMIANKEGAILDFFNRFENISVALPPYNKKRNKGHEYIDFKDNPIRLYTYRISDSIVILFNGGIKLTHGTAQRDPNVSMAFNEAIGYIKRIEDMIEFGDIDIKERFMLNSEGNKEFEI